MNRVTNTTLISNFAAVYRLDLLYDLTGPLYMPVEVYEEIQEGQMAGYQFYDAIEQHIWPFAADGWLRLVTMTEEELQHFALLPLSLHQADRACLSIARQRGWGLLSVSSQ